MIPSRVPTSSRTRRPPAHTLPMITLRVRTKDGMERLKVESTVTLAAVRELVSTQLGVPLEEQVRRQLPAPHTARAP